MGWRTGVGGAGGGAGGSSEATLDAIKQILQDNLEAGQEQRFDIPAVLANGFIYVGRATAGSLTSAAAWRVTRTSFDALANPSRKQILTGQIWDDRVVLAW